mmetsp:Transcript_31921/g.85418  ORF Transcript_31921/g.85418 Transcript_31921/m.85418 type:complete len:238 (-) Transcript_31921:143-856(-)
MPEKSRTVVIFDLGGVVIDSPIMTIRSFCARRGIADLNPFLGKSRAWNDFMTGKLVPASFSRAVFEECQASSYADGVGLGVDGWGHLLTELAGDRPRPQMLEALRRLREAGLCVAALTNNFDTDPLPDPEVQAQAEEEHRHFVSYFDHFIESRVVGLSKPDPRFYEYALKQIGCASFDAVFLDDLGANLKVAKALGIHTILVKNDSATSYLRALRDLEDVTGVKLISDGSAPPLSRL